MKWYRAEILGGLALTGGVIASYFLTGTNVAEAYGLTDLMEETSLEGAKEVAKWGLDGILAAGGVLLSTTGFLDMDSHNWPDYDQTYLDPTDEMILRSIEQSKPRAYDK